ncbi:MAG TPA: P1 family peptidase [Thermoanaerobaculia bacterium]|nr:P1 family peptidase [Thermoanaerobaculia bacterium]
MRTSVSAAAVVVARLAPPTTLIVAFALAAMAPPAGAAEPAGRPRLRELGVSPGVLSPGPHNAITDVEGIAVGHRTVVEGDAVRTGVTAILPHRGNLFQDKVPAAVHVANGFGKAAGFLQVAELGTIETPIVLTNTLAVGTAVEAVVRWTLAQPGNEQVRSVNAVVGETNDGWLNDIRSLPVTGRHVDEAIAAATVGPVATGSVGAGTGTQALGWKAGIGTSSRRLPASLGGWTVGALVQSNFGGILTFDGVPVGEELGRWTYREQVAAPPEPGPSAEDVASPPAAGPGASGDGSVIVVLATDAPLSAHSLERLARRAVPALGRVGSFIGNGSGDFVVAFSTAQTRAWAPAEPVLDVRDLADEALSPLFLATVEAVEEAILDSLVTATSVTGRDGHRAEAIPLDDLRDVLRRHGRLTD